MTDGQPASAGPQVAAVSLADARVFVARHHRHNRPPVGHRFSLGAVVDEAVRGVVIVGRPVARGLDDGQTLEATRVCSDGTPNVCSLLLGAAWRAARALGYQRLVTYTQLREGGASLRGAGWRPVANLRPRGGWNSQGRPRQDRHPTRVPRQRWEVTTADFRNTDRDCRDETTPTCQVCSAPLGVNHNGRPARYCSAACRQRAYRQRRRVSPP